MPVDYVAAPLLAAMAAAVGNSRTVTPWDGWSEPAVLWIGVVGDPSSGKSPGADPVLSALKDVERDLGEGFDERHRAWMAEVEAAKLHHEAWKQEVASSIEMGDLPPTMPASAVVPEEPKPPRMVISDTTPESAATIAAANPRGLMAYRDELAGWLCGMDRYNNNSRPFWVEAFGARPFTVDRMKTGGSISIERLAISVFGGIQPDRLADLLLHAEDDGLAARFMWFWPDPLPPTRPNAFPSPIFIRSALSRLCSLSPYEENGVTVPVTVRLTDEAAERFQEWREEHHADVRVGGMLASAWGKLPGLILRLALVLELGIWATSDDPEPSTIDCPALLRAVVFVETYLKPMLLRVYGDAAVPPVERTAALIARWIKFTGSNRINARDLRRKAGIPGNPRRGGGERGPTVSTRSSLVGRGCKVHRGPA